MAKIVNSATCYVATDKDGVAIGAVLWDYEIVDGAARKSGHTRDDAPDFAKTFHNTGAVGEFWRDGIDAIKTKEGI